MSSTLEIQHGGTHYKGMVIEPIVYCERNALSPSISFAIKHLSRHHLKNEGVEDLKKAIHYAQMALEFHYGVKSEVTYTKDVSPSELPQGTPIPGRAEDGSPISLPVSGTSLARQVTSQKTKKKPGPKTIKAAVIDGLPKSKTEASIMAFLSNGHPTPFSAEDVVKHDKKLVPHVVQRILNSQTVAGKLKVVEERTDDSPAKFEVVS